MSTDHDCAGDGATLHPLFRSLAEDAIEVPRLVVPHTDLFLEALKRREIHPKPFQGRFFSAEVMKVFYRDPMSGLEMIALYLLFLIRIFLSLILSWRRSFSYRVRTLRHFSFELRSEWIEAEKAAYKCRSSDVEYVSTNDVITSWIMRKSGCITGCCVLNLRGKAASIPTEPTKGNFVDYLFLWGDISPCDVRRKIATSKDESEAKLGFPLGQQAMCLFHIFNPRKRRNMVLSNIASFAVELKFPGAHQTMQMPLRLFDVRRQPMPLIMMNASTHIFRPTPTTYGVSIISEFDDENDYLDDPAVSRSLHPPLVTRIH